MKIPCLKKCLKNFIHRKEFLIFKNKEDRKIKKKESFEDYINYDRVVDLLTDLVKIESPYFHEAEIMDYTHAWLQKRGLPAEFHRYNESKITKFKGTNIVGELVGHEDGPTVLLNGHLDTVKICDGWTKDPLGAEIEGGKLYGVGALDMKGGDAAIMLALEAFAKTVPRFNGKVLYTFVSDEEGPYGLGTDALIVDNMLKDADVAVVPEPSSGFCGIEFPCLCLGARGGWNYTVTVTGKSAHAANPQQGINAITEASKLIYELEKSEFIVHEKLGRGDICIIDIKGGGAACSVADTAEFSVFRHVTIGEDRDYLKREVESAAKRAKIRGDFSVKFRDAPNPDSVGFQPYVVSESNPYTKAFKESVFDITKEDAHIAYFSSIGDFNYLGSRARLPTYIFGPNGKNYHSADEYVELDSVIKTSKVIYDFLKRVLI